MTSPVPSTGFASSSYRSLCMYISYVSRQPDLRHHGLALAGLVQELQRDMTKSAYDGKTPNQSFSGRTLSWESNRRRVELPGVFQVLSPFVTLCQPLSPLSTFVDLCQPLSTFVNPVLKCHSGVLPLPHLIKMGLNVERFIYALFLTL
jgi:hypothetical protein